MSDIIETDNFGTINDNILSEDDILVIFDVDNTLINPRDEILKPRNKKIFKSIIQEYRDKNINRDLFQDIRSRASFEVVDDKSIDLIKILQTNSIPIIALTAAPGNTRDKDENLDNLGIWRVNELKKVGFDFSSSFSEHELLQFSGYEKSKYKPLFRSGVLYASMHEKGKILEDFLSKISFRPKKIIFIDDELENLNSVQKLTERMNIKFLGFHFHSNYICSNRFELSIYKKQIKYFITHDVWINDEDVIKI